MLYIKVLNIRVTSMLLALFSPIIPFIILLFKIQYNKVNKEAC